METNHTFIPEPSSKDEYRVTAGGQTIFKGSEAELRKTGLKPLLDAVLNLQSIAISQNEFDPPCIIVEHGDLRRGQSPLTLTPPAP